MTILEYAHMDPATVIVWTILAALTVWIVGLLALNLHR
jgi:hypothetical protein